MRSYMLRRSPGRFVAGEMLDWEAPTGGYLLQACFATGVAAGQGALAWSKDKKSSAGPSRFGPPPVLEEAVLDLRVDAVHPFLGADGAILVVADVAFQLRDAVFRFAQLQRELVRDVHGALAVLLRHVDRVLQHRDDRLAGAVERVAFILPLSAVRAATGANGMTFSGAR